MGRTNRSRGRIQAFSVFCFVFFGYREEILLLNRKEYVIFPQNVHNVLVDLKYMGGKGYFFVKYFLILLKSSEIFSVVMTIL